MAIEEKKGVLSPNMLRLICVYFIILLPTTTARPNIRHRRNIATDKYHNFSEMETLLKELNERYPSLTKLHAIGTSLENRTLWAFQITDNVEQSEPGEPMFKYVGNMHGNEVIGRQILIYLIQYLLEHYELDDTIRRMVDTTNIFIMPSMNPDGFEHASVNDCDGLQGRGNALNVDLNRDFPDQFVPRSEYHKVQPETRALMNWIVNNKFVLSANLHGGSVVASYPFDDSAQHKPSGEYSATPDDAVFRLLAHTYANKHKTMHAGDTCSGDYFPGGVTNGANWYDVPGRFYSYM